MRVLHLDIDSFYCSAERIKDETLGGIPFIVCSGSGDEDFDEEVSVEQGVVLTASYEARAFGVKSAMLIKNALKLCPHLKMVPPNHSYYRELSKKLYSLLHEFSPVVEAFSIDEFFCDISGIDIDPLAYGKKIQKIVFDELKLPVSVGIAPTKWIAKLATEKAKPSGICFVKKDEILSFIENEPIGIFSGIGKKMQEKLSSRGIETLGDAARNERIFKSLGEGAYKIYLRLIGKDNEPIANRPRKSVGASRTFSPLLDRDELRRRALILARHVSSYVFKHNLNPKSFSLSLRYEYGKKANHQITKERLFSDAVFKEEMLNLLEKCDSFKNQRVVFLSLSASNFDSKIKATSSLLDFEDDQKNYHISKTLQSIRDRYGIDSVLYASELKRDK